MVSGLKPELWGVPLRLRFTTSKLAAKKGKVLAEITVRFGFASFESRHGNFLCSQWASDFSAYINPPDAGSKPRL